MKQRTLFWIRNHKALLIGLVGVLVLASVPLLTSWLVIGSHWQGVPQNYFDEHIYYSQVHEIGDGQFWHGNPYYLEHRDDPSIVLFGSSWISAIPFLFGFSFLQLLVINFFVWSLVYVILFYWLFRESLVPKWLSALGAIFAYIQSYDLVFRTSSRQTVFPFFLLFYIAFVRFIKHPQDKKSIILLGIISGLSFYIFGFLWQTVVVTLGLLFLYALVTKKWQLMRTTLMSSGLGALVGAPAIIYTIWISQQPFFWEGASHFGLHKTHIPMAEVVYSGGWIGIILLICLGLYFFSKKVRSQESYFIFLLIGITGGALWIMQGNNLISGTLMETGEHVRRFIVPWLAFATITLGWFTWKNRALIGRPLLGMGITFLFGLLTAANLIFAYQYFSPFFHIAERRDMWVDNQLHAAPLAWLESQEKEPVVIWSHPHDFFTINIPIMTKHYVLYEEPATLTLTANKEHYERYLVSRYFDNPSVQDLKDDIANYVGRASAYHIPKTLERKIKICKILHFYNERKDCGTVLSAQAILGDAFFNDLEQHFTADIKPNIIEYLKKYHVSYIVKDVVKNPEFHPEQLTGTNRVYTDDRYQIYKISY